MASLTSVRVLTGESSMDECDIIAYLCKYIQFKCALWIEYIRSLQTGIMVEYPVMFPLQGTYVWIEQTSEAIRETYEMCRAGGREDWNWEPLV